MITSSNGNIFRITGHLCGEFTGPDEFPTQRPVTRSFDTFFDLRLNKQLSKQSWGWWFEMLSHPLWRHCNDYTFDFPAVSDHPNTELCGSHFTKKYCCNQNLMEILVFCFKGITKECCTYHNNTIVKASINIYSDLIEEILNYISTNVQ